MWATTYRSAYSRAHWVTTTHDHRHRHRLLPASADLRVRLPAPVAAPGARRPEGDRRRQPGCRQGARPARPAAAEAIHPVVEGHLEEWQRRPAEPLQGSLLDGLAGRAQSSLVAIILTRRPHEAGGNDWTP